MSEWQPAKSAPANVPILGTWADSWKRDIHIEVVVKRVGSAWEYVYDGDFAPTPTHWMPLPAPPAAKTEVAL